MKLHKMLTTTATAERQLAHCLKFANGNIKGLNLQEVVPKCKIARSGLGFNDGPCTLGYMDVPWLQRHCLVYMGFVHCGGTFQMPTHYGTSIYVQIFPPGSRSYSDPVNTWADSALLILKPHSKAAFIIVGMLSQLY